MTQTASATTLKDVFTAAVATYGGKDAPRLGNQWTLLSMDEISKVDSSLSATMKSVGFSGQVNVNLQTGEIIIADRGTDNLKNLVTDAGVAVDTIANSQQVAESFARAGLIAAQTKLKQAGVQLSAVYTTGHSLGGAESEMQAGMLSCATDSKGTPLVPIGVPITNVSLDAPGIAGLANRGDRDRYASYNFSSQGDVVHLSGGNDLNGTTEVSLPVGPPMWSTAGLIVGGAAVAAAAPGPGWLAGAVMTMEGLDNAAHAHSSELFHNATNNTALGDVPMPQLHAGMSSSQLQDLFQASQSQYRTVADTTSAVAASAGFGPDRNNAMSFGLFGLDENGKIDPALAKDSAGHAATDVDQWLEANGYRERTQPQPKFSM